MSRIFLPQLETVSAKCFIMSIILSIAEDGPTERKSYVNLSLFIGIVAELMSFL